MLKHNLLFFFFLQKCIKLPFVLDYDGDQFIGPKDLEQAVTALTRSELNEDEVGLVVEKVLDEGDLDDDGKLSFLEFEAVISKAPDFLGYVILYS